MKFPEQKPQKGGWTKWIHPRMTNYYMACCDCGLVHTMNFRVFKVIKTRKNGIRDVEILPKKQYAVEFKVKRNYKHTKDLRKQNKLTQKS